MDFALILFSFGALLLMITVSYRWIKIKTNLRSRIRKEIKNNEKIISELRTILKTLHIELNEINRKSHLILKMDQKVIILAHQRIDKLKRTIDLYQRKVDQFKKREIELVDLKRQVELLDYIGKGQVLIKKSYEDALDQYIQNSEIKSGKLSLKTKFIRIRKKGLLFVRNKMVITQDFDNVVNMSA